MLTRLDSTLTNPGTARPLPPRKLRVLAPVSARAIGAAAGKPASKITNIVKTTALHVRSGINNPLLCTEGKIKIRPCVASPASDALAQKGSQFLYADTLSATLSSQWPSVRHGGSTTGETLAPAVERPLNAKN